MGHREESGRVRRWKSEEVNGEILHAIVGGLYLSVGGHCNQFEPKDIDLLV
jgi:hypothetical protein